MKKIFKGFFGATASSNNVPAEAPVSLERVQHILDYARRRNLGRRGKYAISDRSIGQSIDIVSEQRDFTAGRGNPVHEPGAIVTQYRSVSWSYMPDHLGVYLVDGTLEFRASHDGIGPRETMPLAEDPDDLAGIKRLFDYWYEEFGLPESLDLPVNPPKQFLPSGDALRDIVTYLKTASVDVFHELFEEGGPVIWIDWGEEDDDIVMMTAEVLGLKDLSVRFENDSCDLLIKYRGIEHRVGYRQVGVADRDTTIIALNNLLRPEHELRLCNASKGSDTLGLMALPSADWALLEHKCPEACAEHFSIIGKATAMFGRSD
jgi:hypothetical protein